MSNSDHFLAIRLNSILFFKKFRYLKLALAILVASVLLYAFDNPPIKPGGSTWLGYGLGTLGAVLILYLMAFGMRKRAYRSTSSTLGTLRGWLSGHVYLGSVLLFVVTLHTGFEFGWNVHTYTYALMVLVILSGVWGLVCYLRFPALMGNLLNGQTLQQHGQVLHELDLQCQQLALNMPAEIQIIVSASANGKIFSGYWQRFTGKNPACETQKALDTFEQKILVKLYRRSSKTEKISFINERRKFDIQAKVQELYTLQFRRLQQLIRIREYVKLKSFIEIWLMFHVPLSFALLAALIAHIVSVFFYW